MSEEIYNDAFYDLQSKESYESALVVLALLRQKLGEKIKLDSIIDFGCGVGSWLAAAKEVGFKHVCGTDGDYVPKDRLMIEQGEFLPNDLSVPSRINIPGEKFDLAMSLEVAEHLPEEVASGFIAKLTSTSDIVLFSAAIPYQGGHGHVNENWLEYWIQKFNAHSFKLLDILRQDVWDSSEVAWWYKQNVVVFIKKQVASKFAFENGFQHSVIHPHQFLNAVHRSKVKVGRSLSEDISYSSNLKFANRVISYGKEISYLAESTSTDKSYNKVARGEALYESLDVNESLEFNNKALAKLHYEKRICLPDYIFLGGDNSLRNNIDFMSKQAGAWLPPTGYSGFFEEYFIKTLQNVCRDRRRSRSFELLREVLSKNKQVDDKWFNLLSHMTCENVCLDWYSSLFNWKNMKKKTCDFSLFLFFMPEETLSALRFNESGTKIFFNEFSDKEKIDLKGMALFFGKERMPIEEFIESNCRKWERVVGRANFLCIRSVKELAKHISPE
jgi:SAM-dependent methyltransferase